MNEQNVINGQLPVEVIFTAESNADEFFWDFDGDNEYDLTSTTNQAQNTFFNEGGNSGFVVAELDGCTDTISFTIIAFTNSFLELFNVITPNGDGKNDSFRIVGNFIASFELNIFNRNGNLIVTLNDLDEKWDPTDSFDTWSPRGEYNDGTYLYYYIAKGLDGQEFKGTGTLTVLGSE
jgi:gliding motility-associated-like protein